MKVVNFLVDITLVGADYVYTAKFSNFGEVVSFLESLNWMSNLMEGGITFRVSITKVYNVEVSDDA